MSNAQPFAILLLASFTMQLSDGINNLFSGFLKINGIKWLLRD